MNFDWVVVKFFLSRKILIEFKVKRVAKIKTMLSILQPMYDYQEIEGQILSGLASSFNKKKILIHACDIFPFSWT